MHNREFLDSLSKADIVLIAEDTGNHCVKASSRMPAATLDPRDTAGRERKFGPNSSLPISHELVLFVGAT
ncbi:unnamed protein product [marine sediment metagenome]|uniref:Uncharacterized protein n=1 Tax=marine sediment metagenome TaxID=412755 RepID=X1MG97_9ZZZZ